MTITKFSSASPPSFVKTDVFNAGPPVIMASWVNLQGNDIKLSDGDYIIQDDNNIVTGYITAAQYAVGNGNTQIIKETVSKQCLRTIWQTLSQSGLTDTVKASLINTILSTIVALTAGEVKAALIIANATATTTDFTTARKNALITILNNSIALL